MSENLPEMNHKEEAEFWQSHEATDYLHEMEPVYLSRGRKPDNRCHHCGQVMLSRKVDVPVASGRAVLRQLRELYCPDHHETRLAPEAQRLVEAVSAVMNLASPLEPSFV